jgi:hypothetical protein
MPSDYAHYQFRIELLSPVAADSPFDSDTLWGRVICALMEGSQSERQLGESWIHELADKASSPDSDWYPPLIVSEGFQCGSNGRPWLPVPLAIRRKWEDEAPAKHKLSRKEIKKLDRVPLETFLELCEGNEADLEHLRGLCADAPQVVPSLQPHLAMDRLSGAGLEGMLYMMPLSVYRAGPAPTESVQNPPLKEPPPQICFFLKVRQSADAALIESALKCVCGEGWGHGKSRGLGRIRLVSPDGWQRWQPETFEGTANGFVSLSHFCPAANNPTRGYWDIQAKHPVPAQFVGDKRVPLGEGKNWRVRSFLRLRAGSCFGLETAPLRECYGRILRGLLKPADDDTEENTAPSLFHYALSFPWPLKTTRFETR